MSLPKDPQKIEDMKRKISIAHKGKYLSEEHKRKMSEAHKGITFSKERRANISKALKGKPSSLKGKFLSKEIRKKMSEARKGKFLGEKNSNWHGGLSYEPYSVDWTETLKRSIRERDHYICQVCWDYGNIVHHINYDKKNCNPDNLITLCVSHNSKANRNRKMWQRFFAKGNLLKAG